MSRFSRGSRVVVVAALFSLAGCGGDSSSDGPPVPEPAPAALSYESPQVFAVGAEITPLNPTVTGTVTSYSVSPDLPAGVTLDSGNGQISGTPTAPVAAADYTITASNSSGSTTFDFTITVAGVDVLPGSVSRIVASGTSVYAEVAILPRYFELSGPLFSAASGPKGVIRPAVTVVEGDAGSYLLTFATKQDALPGHYSEQVTLALCTDPGCAERHVVPSFEVNLELDVLAPESEWLGDNLSGLVAWQDVGDWTTFQGNSAHTGHVSVTVDPNEFSTRWRAPAMALSAGWYPLLSTLTTSDGRFFIPGNNRVYARSEHDGQALWDYDFSALQYPSVNPPSVADGVVYVAAGQQSSTFMFALDADDGSLVFKSPMHAQWEHYLAPTVGANGIYTNAGTYGGLFAFDSTGVELYFAPLDQTSAWTPAVDATGVYTYTGGNLQVNDPTSGAVLASIFDPTFVNYVYEIGGSPVLGAPGSVFAANYMNSILNGGDIGNTLTRFNTLESEIEWQIPGVYPTTPAYANGVLFVANERPLRLEARSEDDGSLLWYWTPPYSGDEGFDSEVLLTDNLVFVSTNRSVYAIDLNSRRAVWSYPQTGRLALSKNGILYIQGETYLTAINLK